MKQLTILLISIFLFTSLDTFSQDLSLLAKHQDDAIHLKILPQNSRFWFEGVENGYTINRRALGEESEFTIINQSPILPMNEADFQDSEEKRKMYDFHKESVQSVKDRNMKSSFAEALTIANEDDNNYSLYILLTMRNSDFSALSGLHYIDETIEKGKSYQYIVSIVDSDVESKMILIDESNQLKSPTLRSISKEGAVRLEWYHEEDSPFAGYYLEKSSTGLAYERINKAPYLPEVELYIDTIASQKVVEISRIDSLYINYQPHYYRLVAFDIWGHEHSPSEPIVDMGIDQTAPEIGFFELSVDTIENNINIDWEPSPDSDVASYFITQSYVLNGQDSVIIQDVSPNDITEFSISNPIELQNHYIKIGAIDTSGNIALSDAKAAFVPDITAPSKVLSLKAEADSNGVVTLNWSPSEDTNLNGYLVFRSFLKDSNYIKITDTVYKNTIYQDTCALQLLNKKRFYYVTALDNSFNTSPRSEVFQVILPDTVAPSRTLISEINELSDSIEIRWKKNQSSDVIQYQVYKKLGNSWVIIGVTGTGFQSFMDASTNEDQVGYKIFAIDESGNIGNNSPPKYKTLRGDDTDKVLDLKIEKEDSSIILSWNEIGSKYKIYQEEADGFILKDFVDKAIYEKNNTTLSKGKYYIKAYDERGRFITKSKIVQL